MNDLLERAIELPIEKYLDLIDPIFKGQTPCDSENKYWIVWEDQGILYKIHNIL